MYHPNFQISYVNLEHTDLGICFADSHGNLKIKFSYNKNVSYDSFQSFLEAPDKKLSNREREREFMNKSISKNEFLSFYTDLDLLLFFWWYY